VHISRHAVPCSQKEVCALRSRHADLSGVDLCGGFTSNSIQNETLTWIRKKMAAHTRGGSVECHVSALDELHPHALTAATHPPFQGAYFIRK